MSTSVYLPLQRTILPSSIWPEVFLRLQWSKLSAVEDRSIEIGLRQDGTAELLPFLCHSLAMENLAVQPTTSPYIQV
jgi:hypothetical protein